MSQHINSKRKCNKKTTIKPNQLPNKSVICITKQLHAKTSVCVRVCIRDKQRERERERDTGNIATKPHLFSSYRGF